MAGELTIRLQRGDVIVELQGDVDTVRAAFAALKVDGLGALAPFLGLGVTVATKSAMPKVARVPTASLANPSASFQFVFDKLRLPTNQQNFASDISLRSVSIRSTRA